MHLLKTFSHLFSALLVRPAALPHGSSGRFPASVLNRRIPAAVSLSAIHPHHSKADTFLFTSPSDVYTAVGLIIVALLMLALFILNLRKKTIITDTSKALEETETRYRLLFEHSPVPLMEEDLSRVKTFLDQLKKQGVVDLNRYFAENPGNLNHCAAMVRIIDANRAALKMYGAETVGALSQRTPVLPDDQSLHFRNELVQLSREGGSEIILENRTLGGTALTVERRAVIAAGFKQTWRKVFVTVIDITEQVRLRNENKSFEKQLQQTQKLEAIGSLAGGIAHDFNNILAPIMGRAELMLIENNGNEPLRDHCRGIIDAARRARNLVKQILTFSRQVDQEIQPVSLAAIVREVINLLRPTLPATIEIECSLSDSSPLVMADGTQLHQVIMNLATNAFHAMEDHGGCLRFHLETVTLEGGEFNELSISPGRYQQLRIEDSGHGMDQATLARIFDPYFTTKPRGKGTGLGLAVVIGILRGYGGEIRVRSEVGKGTVFTLYFPVIEPAAEQEPVEYGHHDMLPRGSEHILLVDDEKSIADVTAGMLERLGYKVTMRISSYDALEAFRNLADRIDLLIADLNMPQMTGLQLYREIRKIRPDIKVIICTGFSEQLGSSTSKSIGIQGFLHKPVVMSDLARCVRSVLDGGSG
jgi:signal transduction histidine kinase/CheY-like chemotaxis protein